MSARYTAEDYQLLVETITDYAIFILDRDGTIATWNRGGELIKGYRADEIIGRHFSTFYELEAVNAGVPARKLAEAAETGRVEDEGWRLRKDGTRFWANVVITALRNEDGTLRGFAKVTRDLTQRREMEDALRQSEQRFHSLVDAVTDYAVFMLDADGNVATWNAGARKTKGYDEHEIVGRHFSAFYPEDDRRAGRPQILLERVRTEGRIEDEGWRIRKDGTRFWANVIITRLVDDASNIVGFAKVTRDLTSKRAAADVERKLIVEQAARSAAESVATQAEEANRIKDEFLATVSHELRTPLNAIVGWSKMLLQEPLAPMLARGMEAIDRNANAQVKLIEDILDVSRIITGKMRIEPRSMDLGAVTAEAIDAIRPSALAKRIEIDFATSERARVTGDPERLRQIAWNLLSNAVKFTPNHGHIRVRVEADADRVTLSVADDGRGIDPSFVPFVFERFKQEDGSISRRVGGLGLGLALVRHIVELHGGTAEVESVLGRGSKFTISIPKNGNALLPPASGTSHRPVAHQATAERGVLQGLHVLIVDDDFDAREVAGAVARSAGADVTLASSAEDALAALEDITPDVVVSDIGMPVQDGYELMRKIRALPEGRGRSVPTMALTAYTRAEDQRKALAAGFTTHLGKPIDPRDLVNAIANLASLRPR